jgi:hypothetical protein
MKNNSQGLPEPHVVCCCNVFCIRQEIEYSVVGDNPLLKLPVTSTKARLLTVTGPAVKKNYGRPLTMKPK